MSEDIVPYGNSESEVAALRLRLHHAEAQRDAFKAALSKAVMAVLAEAVDVQKEVNAAWSRAKAEAWHTEEADAALADLKAEADRLKADNERLTVLQSETLNERCKAEVERDYFCEFLKWAGQREKFAEWHAWRMQRTDAGPVASTTFVNVDPLLREAIASAQLTSLPKGGAS